MLQNICHVFFLCTLVVLCFGDPLTPEIWGTNVTITEMQNHGASLAVIGEFRQTAFFGDKGAVTPCNYGAFMAMYRGNDFDLLTYESQHPLMLSGLESNSDEFFSAIVHADITSSPHSGTIDNYANLQTVTEGQFVMQFVQLSSLSRAARYSPPLIVADRPFIIHDIDISGTTFNIVGELGDASNITIIGKEPIISDGFSVTFECTSGISSCEAQELEESLSPIIYVSGSIAVHETDQSSIVFFAFAKEFEIFGIETTSFITDDNAESIFISGTIDTDFVVDVEFVPECNYLAESRTAVSILITDKGVTCVFGEKAEESLTISAWIVDQSLSDAGDLYVLGYFGKHETGGNDKFIFEFGECCVPLLGLYTSFVLRVDPSDLSCLGMQTFGTSGDLTESVHGQCIATDFMYGDALVSATNPMAIHSPANDDIIVANIVTLPIVPITVEVGPGLACPTKNSVSLSSTSVVTSTSAQTSEKHSSSSDISSVSSETSQSSETTAVADQSSEVDISSSYASFGDTANHSWLTVVLFVIVTSVLVGALVSYLLYKKRHQLVPAASADVPLHRFSQLEEEFQ